MGDWSMLPCDILGEIALRLDKADDLVYFSAVCRSWYHAFSQVKSLWSNNSLMPWLFLTENTNDNPDCVRKVYNHTTKRFYCLKVPETFGARCWGSSHGWIALQTFDYQVHLFNPLTKVRITSLPSVLTMSNPNLEPDVEFDFQDIPNDPLERQQWYFDCYVMRVIVLKMSHDGGGGGGGGDLLVAAIFRHKFHSLALALARPGDQSWTYVVSGVVDVAYLKDQDRIYIIGWNGQLLYCDIKECGSNLEDIKVMEYAPDMISTPILYNDNMYPLDKVYLLDLCGNLVMVIRRKHVISDGITYFTRFFEVYMIENNKWVETKDIGNFSIFVGHHSSMACPATAANKCISNSIYYTDDECTLWRKVRHFGGYDMDIYDIGFKEPNNIVCMYESNEGFYFSKDDLSPFCPPFFFMPKCFSMD